MRDVERRIERLEEHLIVLRRLRIVVRATREALAAVQEEPDEDLMRVYTGIPESRDQS